MPDQAGLPVLKAGTLVGPNPAPDQSRTRARTNQLNSSKVIEEACCSVAK